MSNDTLPNISDRVKDLALAIAHAEGFGIPGNVPTRAHNPGDLKIPGWKGATTGTEGITVFPDDASGWDRLYKQLNFIAEGKSHIYNLHMTFSEFSSHWTDTQESNWLDNVLFKLQELGYAVTKDTILANYFDEGD